MNKFKARPQVPRLCGAVGAYCYERFIVTTRGDEVKQWYGRDGMLALLAPIDTLDEASLVMNWAGYEITCPEADKAHVTSEGIEVTAIKYAGSWANIGTTTYRIRVTPDGSIHRLE